jgi:RNA polymerase sigma-70 factor (ECF subfamily)
VVSRRERSDEELLAHSASGDEQAFAVFFDRHLAAVTAYFRVRVAEPELAYDLAAETFAALVVAADRFDAARGSGAGWLFGIARNKLLESLRSGRVEAAARRKLGVEPQLLDDDDLRRVEELARTGASALDRLVAGLPEAQRVAVIARVVDERPYAEIAAELGCSEMVVRQRVHRGLARLRTTLEEADERA